MKKFVTVFLIVGILFAFGCSDENTTGISDDNSSGDDSDDGTNESDPVVEVLNITELDTEYSPRYVISYENTFSHGEHKIYKVENGIEWYGLWFSNDGTNNLPYEVQEKPLSVFDFINSNGYLIEYPLEIGTSWYESVSLRGINWSGASSIRSLNDTVEFEENQFENCIRIRTEITGEGDDSFGETVTDKMNALGRGTRYTWLKKGVGIVKIEYNHENGNVTVIELDTYSVESSDSYFPMAVGNSWTYNWYYKTN
ncbi:MAG: hypothetical protein FXF47_02935 [Candidatus Mcinerneyibacterium aminivorans]|uniref:Lipoprotein n=1 Tax=Candidatus Mcinerneyibacterium aminivorans TaxID=2703815 RepID=A0A5D0MI27_9BACT|nr:MAG: hypothetical protein FXF47_02935 [Candidatus Mcinerneyibacterium aminivorans]